MSTEFKLSYTGSQVNEKLGQIDKIVDKIDQITESNIIEPSTNKFNYAEFVTGKIMQVTGKEANGSIMGYTNFVPVSEGDIVIFGSHGDNGFANYKIAVIAAYDNDKKAVSSAGWNGIAMGYKTSYTVPNGIAYVVLTVELANSPHLETAQINCTADGQPFPYEPYYEGSDGDVYYPYGYTATQEYLAGIQGNIAQMQEAIVETQSRLDTMNTVEPQYDNAVGDKTELGADVGLAVRDQSRDVFVGYYPVGKANKKNYNNLRIVAVNHDDLQYMDYVAVRKLYNKYGFNANFSFILQPFADAATQKTMVENVKRLVADGNAIGLHAIFQQSALFANKLFDVRPDGTFTFAPTLAEQTTVVSGGKNVFGYTVTDSTVLSGVGFANPPSALSSVAVRSLTEEQYIQAIRRYCLYTMVEQTSTGLDLDGNTQTWSALHWLEHWYNELIDNTLGYSNDTDNLLDNYFADYEVPDGTAQTAEAYSAYYPDSEHLKSGKIVFFDDTANPNYSDSSYQKVGRFKQGLFKGSASALNSEVIDRCIDIAKAFCRHYFDYDNFTCYDRHGVRYVINVWTSNGFPYDNRDMTILTGEIGRFWHSRNRGFMTVREIFLSKGIKMMLHGTPESPLLEAQDGLYFGQGDVRYPYFHHVQSLSGRFNYLTLFGSDKSVPMASMNYATYLSYIDGRMDLLKFAYENAGQNITKPDGTGSMYMFPYIKNCIDSIRACVGTGKIPCMSWDTIAVNPAMMAAVEIMMRYCYENDIIMVPVEEARQIAASRPREYRSNYMPNPKFTQSLLNSFGGSSTANDAYIPDGWINGFGSDKDGTYVVHDEVVSEPGIDLTYERVFTVTSAPGKKVNLYSRIFGLQPGTYKFTCMLKGSGKLNAYVKKNSDYIDNAKYGITPNHTLSATSEWEAKSFTIIIPEPYQKMVDTTDAASQYCHGYEDNVVNISIELAVNGSQSLSIFRPKLTLVNE